MSFYIYIYRHHNQYITDNAAFNARLSLTYIYIKEIILIWGLNFIKEKKKKKKTKFWD